MVSLRGALVPVVDLAKYAGVQTDTPRDIMIVTEYNGHTQGFLVEAVDTILRLDWSMMRVPPEMLLAQMGGLVTAVTELDDGRLVMMMDVEKVLAETSKYDDDLVFRSIPQINKPGCTVFFADDSVVARKQIERTLDAMMAQDFQDLTGQVIKKIVGLAQNLENQLVQVLVDVIPDARRNDNVNSLINGPVISGEGRTDVVVNQQQVDDLLGSLGF